MSQECKRFISYFGGKAKIAPWVVSKIPKHLVYVEPFFGSGAVMFAKPPIRNSKYIEIINDINSDVYNFYKVVRDNPKELVAMLDTAIYSRELNDESRYSDPKNDIEKAFYFFVNINQAVNGILGEGWMVSNQRASAQIFQNKIKNLIFNLKRIKNCHIENRDALKVIKEQDSPQSFFYCDPPYVGVDQRHYRGYSQKDFSALVDLLANIKGSFLLSNYDQSLPFEKFTKSTICHSQKISIKKNDTQRTEVLYRKFAQKPSKEICQIYRTREFQKFVAHPWEVA